MRIEQILRTILIILVASKSYSQSIGDDKSDSINFHGITISGFTLCKTTLSQLYDLSSDFSEVEVEEMDYPKNCYGRNGNYDKKKWFASKRYLGLILQKEEASDYTDTITSYKMDANEIPIPQSKSVTIEVSKYQILASGKIEKIE